MYALLIIDMINDFVYLKFGNERVQSIISNILKLKEIAYKKGWKVIYIQDYHKYTDPEIKVWGEHAMEGTHGSEIIEELSPGNEDIVIKKNSYNGFFNTNLDRVLRAKSIKNIIFAGVTTDICVLNTVANAFYLGYETLICRECTESMDEKSKYFALEYMQKNYDTKIVNIKDIGVI
ncbi:MAG: isochorismatase family cysteine hydrolase [Thermoplasmata archaeon]